MKSPARYAVEIAIAHLRAAAASLDMACVSDPRAADLLNKVKGQEALEQIAEQLQDKIEEPVS